MDVVSPLLIPAIYKTFQTDSSFLAIMPRPRPGDWLNDEIIGLSEIGVDCLVSLLEKPEETDLILTHEQRLAEDVGMEFFSYPIPDRCVPSHMPSFLRLVHRLANRVREGKSVAIHCRAGIGRSGLTVAATMVALGVCPDTVFKTISLARGVEVPDTTEQTAWFEQHHPSFRMKT